MIKAGMLLVARPNLPARSIFSSAAILLTEHALNGSTGLIVNKESGHTLNDVLKDQALHTPDDIKVYTGGPVNPHALIMIHTDEWYCSNTMQIPGGFAMSSDTLMLEKIQTLNRPNDWRLCVGLCGWMPGQLEHEIKNETWLVCEPTYENIFVGTGKAQWRKAVDLCASQAVAQFF